MTTLAALHAAKRGGQGTTARVYVGLAASKAARGEEKETILLGDYGQKEVTRGGGKSL